MTGGNRQHRSRRADLVVLTQDRFGGEYLSALGRDDAYDIVHAVTEFSRVLLEIHADITRQTDVQSEVAERQE